MMTLECTLQPEASTPTASPQKTPRIRTREKTSQCDQCERSFRYMSDMQAHRRRHTGEKPFSCNICSRRFVDRSGLVNHQRRHLDGDTWRCLVCTDTFDYECDLVDHCSGHDMDAVTLRTHECLVCGKLLKSQKTLSYHLKNHETTRRMTPILKTLNHATADEGSEDDEYVM